MATTRHPGWRALNKRLIVRGITLDQFHAKCENQDFGCGICSAYLERTSDCCIDHDHASGKFRGVLCAPCNIAIGYFRDNTQTILSAARYLERLRQAGARVGVARSVEDLQQILKGTL